MNKEIENQFGFTKDGKVYRKAFLSYPEKEIGEVRESAEASLAYFEDRFKLLEEKVTGLIKDVSSAENKGSYLMKLIHLKEQIVEYNALGDIPALLDKLMHLEEELKEHINQNRYQNEEVKKEAIEEAEMLLPTASSKEAFERMTSLQKKWLKIGKATEENEEALNEKFRKVVDSFFAERKKFLEAKNMMYDDRVSQYEELINRAERYAKEEDLQEAYFKFNALHTEWKDIGRIPKPRMVGLWKKFKAVSDDFYKKYNAGQSKVKKDLTSEKRDLLEQARKLKQENTGKAYTKLKKMSNAWKKLGKPLNEEEKEMQSEFFSIKDYIFEKNYVLMAAGKRYPDFEKLPNEEKKKKVIHTLKDLIRRDKEELAVIKENSENIFMDDRNKVFNKIVDKKVHQLQKKLSNKKSLLQEVTAAEAL